MYWAGYEFAVMGRIDTWWDEDAVLFEALAWVKLSERFRRNDSELS